jgi:hypothetical protein
MFAPTAAVVKREVAYGSVQIDVDDFVEFEFVVFTYDNGTAEVSYCGSVVAEADSSEDAVFDFGDIARDIYLDGSEFGDSDSDWYDD